MCTLSAGSFPFVAAPFQVFYSYYLPIPDDVDYYDDKNSDDDDDDDTFDFIYHTSSGGTLS